MKLTKKLLLASAVLCAASLGFVACDNEDDPEGAITGSNNSYKVYYENPNGYKTDEKDGKDKNLTGVYRAWKRTSFKHLGALTKITFNDGLNQKGQASKAGADSGVMGFAWDLQDTEDDAKRETFNVVGIRNYNGNVEAYLSRYYNVTEKSANNFGTQRTVITSPTSVPTDVVEWDISGGFETLMKATDSLVLWLDVAIKPSDKDIEGKDESYMADNYGTMRTRSVDGYATAAAGSWVIAIYDADPRTASAKLLKSWIIPAFGETLGSGYNEGGSNGAVKLDTSDIQRKQAVYANIYQGATLSGEWNYAKTYFLANVAPVDGE
ncbi:MAG: hypothetical protein K2H73_04365 [Treponemataceae bacterium]|nr:hypothetical protein [Treponemataceae bacterium]